MITTSDILFYWDARRALVTPTIGGVPTFSRAGNHFARQVGGRHIIAKTDSPRFEPEGLRMAGIKANNLTDPFDFDDTSTAWAQTTGGLTFDNTFPSIYQGESATETTNSGVNPSRFIYEDWGSYVVTANRHVMAYVDVERSTPTIFL